MRAAIGGVVRGLVIGALLAWVSVTLWMRWQPEPLTVELRVSSVWALVWLVTTGALLFAGLLLVLRWPTRRDLWREAHWSLSPYLSDAVMIAGADAAVQWHNQAAKGILTDGTLPGELRERVQRVRHNQQMNLQTITLQGVRYSVQIKPLAHGQTVLLLRAIHDAGSQDSLYDNFIRRIVHDMRNPLAGIIGHANNLRDTVGATDESVAKSATTIVYEAQRLARLVDSMLFDARLAYVPLTIEPFDLLDVVEEAVFAMDERVYQQGKTIQVDAPPQVLEFSGDRDLLLRAIENLLDNSLKYTDEDGAISVTLRAKPQYFEISIADNGVGIPPEYLPERIFQPLVRARSRGDGSGLGLSIVQKIIAMHHGQITAESVVDQGTTMTIQLPRTQTKPATERTS